MLCFHLAFGKRQVINKRTEETIFMKTNGSGNMLLQSRIMGGEDTCENLSIPNHFALSIYFYGDFTLAFYVLDFTSKP